MLPLERLEQDFLDEAAAFDGRFAAPPLRRVFQSVIKRTEGLSEALREMAERYFDENATLQGIAASIGRRTDPVAEDHGRSRRK